MLFRSVGIVSSNVRKKKIREQLNVTKVQSHVMLVQYEDGTIKCEKKIREPSNVTKVQSHVISVLHNVSMVPSNMRKNKRTTKCNKNTITRDLDTT